MSARQTSRATASAPNPAQAIGRLTKDRRTPLNGLKGRNSLRNQGCGWRRALVSCSSLRTALGQSVSADELSVPQSSAIGGLSTSGGCVSASSAPNASHSAATASGDRRPSSRHRRNGGYQSDHVFRTGQPGLLAAGTAHGPAGIAEIGRMNGIGCGTMGATMCMELALHRDDDAGTLAGPKRSAGRSRVGTSGPGWQDATGLLLTNWKPYAKQTGGASGCPAVSGSSPFIGRS